MASAEPRQTVLPRRGVNNLTSLSLCIHSPSSLTTQVLGVTSTSSSEAALRPLVHSTYLKKSQILKVHRQLFNFLLVSDKTCCKLSHGSTFYLTKDIAICIKHQKNSLIVHLVLIGNSFTIFISDIF